MIQPALQNKVLAARQLIIKADFLGRVADAAADGVCVAVNIQTEDARLAARPVQKRDEYFDGRGLARSIRSKETEELAALHLQAHAMHGPRPIRIDLGEITHIDNWLVVHGCLNRCASGAGGSSNATLVV